MKNNKPRQHAYTFTHPKSLDAWQRMTWLWSGIFLASLIFSLIPALQQDFSPAQQLITIILTGVLGLWHIGAVRAFRRLSEFRSHLRFTVPYIVVSIALWFALVRIHPAYYFVLFGLFPQLFWTLPIFWAVIFAALLAGLVIYQQALDTGASLNWWVVLIFLLATGAGIAMGIWIDRIIGQSTERKKLIEELESAQAELAEAERKAGILSERQRLAHEIHDTLAQGFISIVIHLEAAEQALAAAEIQTADKHLAQARNTARESLEQARRVVADLQPEPLAQASLPEAITHVVEKWHERCGVTAVTTITGQTQPLPSNIEVTLLRAVQEALANIHKHARASDVQVTLSYMEDVVILDIQDNGVGLNGETAVPDERRGGFGLTAMRERVAQLDGSVLIESEPNEGTTLVVSIPVMRDQ